MKEELEYYYQSLFDEAELYSRARIFLLFGMLCLLSLSVYAEERYLYFFTLGIFLVQFSLWGLTQKITGLYNLGLSFQKQSMLSDLSIETMDVTTLDNQKQKVSAYVRKKVEDKKKNQSNNSKKPTNKIILRATRLRRLIHGNAYFNHHLFGKTYQRNIKLLGTFSALVAISNKVSLIRCQVYLLIHSCPYHPFYQVSVVHLAYDTDQEQVGHKQENIIDLLLINRLDTYFIDPYQSDSVCHGK